MERVATEIDGPVARADALRSRLLAGGTALVGRELIGIVLSAVALTIILRRVGPEGYGFLGLALALSGYLARVGSIGLDAYLTRYKGSIPERVPAQLLTIVAGVATTFAIALVGVAPLVARVAGLPDAERAIQAIAAYLWLFVVSRVPIAVLEHQLRLGTLASLELVALAGYYAAAVGLVLTGFAYWGVLVGTIVQGAVTATLAFALTRIRPTLRLRRDDVKAAIAYGLPYQVSIWIWALRDLVAPIVVARELGATSLGIFTAALLLANRLAFIRPVVWRISLAGLGKIQDDPALLRRAVTAGMKYQLLALGAILSAFAIIAPVVVRFVIGEAWSGVASIFPFLAVALLANAVFSLHCSALFACGRVAQMTLFHAAHVATLAVAAVVCVDRFGLVGYGVAELFALWTYVLPHVYLRREVGAPSYRGALVVAAAASAVLAITPAAGPVGDALVGGAALLAVLLSRELRSTIRVGFRSALDHAAARKHTLEAA